MRYGWDCLRDKPAAKSPAEQAEHTPAGMAGKRIETALVMARCGRYGEAVEYLQSAERFLMEAEASKSKAELVRAVTEP